MLATAILFDPTQCFATARSSWMERNSRLIDTRGSRKTIDSQSNCTTAYLFSSQVS